MLFLEAETLYMYTVHPFDSYVCVACALFMMRHVQGAQDFSIIIATALSTWMHCMSNKDVFTK